MFLNALFGALQEYRSERAVAALRRLAAPTARGLRDGAWRAIPSGQVVPGDVLQLETGDVLTVLDRAGTRVMKGKGAFKIDNKVTRDSNLVNVLSRSLRFVAVNSSKLATEP